MISKIKGWFKKKEGQTEFFVFDETSDWETDGYGSYASRCGLDCTLQVVRPGKFQCEGNWDHYEPCPDYQAHKQLAETLEEYEREKQ